jgi:hypothetical protein
MFRRKLAFSFIFSSFYRFDGRSSARQGQDRSSLASIFLAVNVFIFV